MVDFHQKMKEEEQEFQPKKTKKKKPLLRYIAYFIGFIVISFFVFSTSVAICGNSDNWVNDSYFFQGVNHLGPNPDKKITKDKKERLDILLLGMGGKGHEGAYLTDTIMLASLKPSKGKVVLTSIPRDLTVPTDQGWQKINSINAYAEQEKKDSGPKKLSQTLERVFDLSIDHYARVDFQGFINIVNEMEGIEVEVDNTLIDKKYPVPGKKNAEDYEERYQTLKIKEGTRHMDGELALKYARSRHAQGVQGSDFNRAKRQQKIIQAVKDKLVSKKTFLKPLMISNIIKELKNHVTTNLSIKNMLNLWDEFKNIESEDMQNKVLKSGPDGLLAPSTSQNGAYILVPRTGNFGEIKTFFDNIFKEDPLEHSQAKLEEKAKVEILNGTTINKLASRNAQNLQDYNFTITRIDNSPKQNFKNSVIYDLSYGENQEALDLLKKKTNAKVSSSLPSWLKEYIKEKADSDEMTKPDFILILGSNQ